MKKLSIVSVFFDYPDFYLPIFEKNLLQDFNKEDYYVVRYHSLEHNLTKESIHTKFTYYRIFQLINFIKENILNKYEFFILLDATDVKYIKNISAVESIMQEYGCDMLFGAERFLWPTTEYSHLYADKNINSPYCFLNAGGFCARPETYIKYANSIISRNLTGIDDQGNWQIEYLLCNDNTIQIDYKSKLIFNTFNAKEDIIIDNNNNVSFKYDISPVFVHDNGGFNENTVKIVDYFA